MGTTKQKQASWRGPGEGHFVLWGEDRRVGALLREVSLTWVTKEPVTTDPEERAVDSGWNGPEGVSLAGARALEQDVGEKSPDMLWSPYHACPRPLLL